MQYDGSPSLVGGVAGRVRPNFATNGLTSSPSEGAKLGLIIVLVGMQRIKVANAVQAEDNRFAVDDETLLPVLQGSLHNPRISVVR